MASYEKALIESEGFDPIKNLWRNVLIVAIEDAMEPFKEQRKDLRESYNENGWLTKEEMRLAVKAYRLYKSETDMEILADYVNKCQRSVGRLTGV